jgi:hypothetical protein
VPIAANPAASCSQWASAHIGFTTPASTSGEPHDGVAGLKADADAVEAGLVNLVEESAPSWRACAFTRSVLDSPHGWRPPRPRPRSPAN